MDHDRIDLGPLDPDHDPARRDRVVGAAMARVHALSRADPPGAGWTAPWRPAIAFAGVVALASAGVLGAVSRRDRDAGAAWMAAGAGVPVPVAEWISGEGTPPAAEVVAAMQGYR